MVLNVLCTLALCCLMGCEQPIDHKGFQLEHARMGEIQINKDTRDSVKEKLGSPTVELPYPDASGQTVWYYVARKVEDRTFSLPSVLEQKTYILRFDASGILRSTEESDKHTSVKMGATVTESSTYESGVLRDVFGSFGQNLSKKSA